MKISYLAITSLLLLSVGGLAEKPENPGKPEKPEKSVKSGDDEPDDDEPQKQVAKPKKPKDAKEKVDKVLKEKKNPDIEKEHPEFDEAFFESIPFEKVKEKEKDEDEFDEAGSFLLEQEMDNDPDGRRLGAYYLRYVSVRFYAMRVFRTGNDAGSYEEWRLRGSLRLSDGNYISGRFPDMNIKDRLSYPGRYYDVYPDEYINRIYNYPSRYSYYTIKTWGSEDDRWPNRDDTLPTCTRSHLPGSSGFHYCDASLGDRSYRMYYQLYETWQYIGRRNLRGSSENLEIGDGE